jgi:hypothetical protein
MVFRVREEPWPEDFNPKDKGLEDDCKRYRLGNCTVFLGTMPNGRIHMSISHPSRYPSWKEIKDARYALVPDRKDMAMYLPRKSEYVNVDPNCFHLYECVCYRGGNRG